LDVCSLRSALSQFTIHRVGEYLPVFSFYLVRNPRCSITPDKGTNLRMCIVFVLFFRWTCGVVDDGEIDLFIGARQQRWWDVPHKELGSFMLEKLREPREQDVLRPTACVATPIHGSIGTGRHILRTDFALKKSGNPIVKGFVWLEGLIGLTPVPQQFRWVTRKRCTCQSVLIPSDCRLVLPPTLRVGPYRQRA
jgi:hypothetical protein